MRSFKGLEADAIIVTDVPRLESTAYFSIADFYVGGSRAKHMLVMLAADLQRQLTRRKCGALGRTI